MVYILKYNKNVNYINKSVSLVIYQSFNSFSSFLKILYNADDAKRSILRFRSLLKVILKVSVPLSELTPIHTRPTGFSAEPPPGPAMPEVATEKSVPVSFLTPSAIAPTHSLLTAPNSSIISALRVFVML